MLVLVGTTGYEEAAAQGIVAGLNAGLAATGREPVVITRDEGYIGVLVDDLVTRGTNEPYRMFTSRAEYRLSLRQDNADIRLTRKGLDLGIISKEREVAFVSRLRDMDRSLGVLEKFSLHPKDWVGFGPSASFHMTGGNGNHRTAMDVLAMPDIELSEVVSVIQAIGVNRSDAELTTFTVPPVVYETVEATAKYAKYLDRQEDEMARWKRAAMATLPTNLQYTRDFFPSLSTEELEKLKSARPSTLHAASQIPGITPNALVFLYNFVSKGNRHRKSPERRDVPTNDFFVSPSE